MKMVTGGNDDSIRKAWTKLARLEVRPSRIAG